MILRGLQGFYAHRAFPECFGICGEHGGLGSSLIRGEPASLSLKDWIRAWATGHGYDGTEAFFDFFYDMKSDVEDSSIAAERRAKQGFDFDEWYDTDFLEMVKPIMKELFGYSDEDFL